MASGQHGGSDHCGQAVKLEDTFTLLESSEFGVVNGIRHLILEHLSSGKEPWLVQSLVDYYNTTRSTRAQEILAEIREPLDKMLVERIQEGLRSTETRLQAVQLLLYIVDQQPPWTHTIVDRPIFPSLLKCLKVEVDIPILMTGVMVLVILLPVVPVSIDCHMQDVFDIFARVAALIARKPANSPDIFILHLHIGVYVLFLRLYGMYPCTFLHFLRVHYAKKENLMVYSDIIAPMLEKVRFHPNLVSGSRDAETSKSRWRKVEPQDIVVNCAKLSLDPIEGTTEDLHCPIIPRSQPPIHTSMRPPAKQQRPQDKPWQEKLEAVSAMFPVVVDPASFGFSPSQLLGLATPPASQRATPAPSFNDLTHSLQQSAAGTVTASPRLVTPTPEVTLREPPSSSVEEPPPPGAGAGPKTTPVPARPAGAGSGPGPRTTPVGLNRTREGASAFTSPFTWRAPTTSQPPSVAPSPIKPNLSSDSLCSQSMESSSAAARNLFFNRIPEPKDEGIPRHIEMRLDKEAGMLGAETGAEAAAGPVPVESLPHIVRNLSAPDSDGLDQEVSRLTEVEEMEAEDGSGGGGPGAADSPVSGSQQLKTADSVIQFMKKNYVKVNRIRFNSLTSHASEPAMFLPEKNPRPGRARSCPPLRRKPLVVDPFHHQQAPHHYTHNSKLDTVSESAVALHTRCSEAAGGGETSFLAAHLASDFAKSFSGSKDGSEASSSGQTRTCACGGKEAVEANPLGNLEQLASFFQCMLAPVKVAVCRQCRHALIGQSAVAADQSEDGHGAATKSDGAESWIKWPGSERAIYSMLSPPELLDRHLAQGSELHAKELAHIPLTSKDNVSWTHFGGGPPVDEINILRGEILLLQNQVMYERHKRSNHAMRNRRLLRRIAHVSALEEQVQALTQQTEGQNKHVQNLQVSLKLLQDHNHTLQQLQDSDEYERLVDFKTTIQQNKDLQEANVELKNLLLTQKGENDELKTELQHVRAKSFEMEKYNDMLKSEVMTVQKWKGQVVQLQKEMLLMGEAQDRLQNHLEQQQRMGTDNNQVASGLLVLALKAEMKELKRERSSMSLSLEATQCRLQDLEEYSKSKDLVAGEMKNNFEAAKATYAEELKSVEEKYGSMIHINQQLDAQVLKLQAENDTIQQKLVSSQLRFSRRRGNNNHSDDNNLHPHHHPHRRHPHPHSHSSREESPLGVSADDENQAASLSSKSSSPARHEGTATTPERGLPERVKEEQQEEEEEGGKNGEEEKREEEREENGEEDREAAVLERHGHRKRDSRRSKDSGRGSMLASGHFSKPGGVAEPPVHEAVAAGVTVVAGKRESPASLSSSSVTTTAVSSSTGKSSSSSSSSTVTGVVSSSFSSSGAADLSSSSTAASAARPISKPRSALGEQVREGQEGEERVRRGVKEEEDEEGEEPAGGEVGSQLSNSPKGCLGLSASRAMMYTDSEDNGSHSSNSNLTTDSGVYSKVDHAN